MAHSHAHAHGEAEGTYFLDQLFTILVCGAIGLVAVLMYQTGMLGRILVPMFFKPVVFAGVALLLLAAVRAVSVWQLAGGRKAEEADQPEAHPHEDCGHDHAHSEDCGHDHTHSHAHAHSHAGDDHGHDHGWAPWRYIVLAIPVFLYFLGLPREGISDAEVKKQGIGATLEQSPKKQNLSMLVGGSALTRVLRNPDPKRYELKFSELTRTAAIPSQQERYEGNIGVIRGQFVPLKSSDREFTLLRVNMTCCAADAIMLETRIEAPEPITGIAPYQWVQVEGLISFQKNEKGKWIPVITLKSNADIDPTAPPTNDTEGF